VIFREELAELILAGKKTETRRPLSDNPRSPWYRKRCGYKLDQVFTINPGRGVPNVGKARVTMFPWQETLRELSLASARREGFASVVEFNTYLEAIHPRRRIYGLMPLWVIRFELVRHAPMTSLVNDPLEEPVWFDNDRRSG